MSMNRSLGEGKITKITKRSAILNCERLGSVTFPLTAANVSNNDCSDLREKYSQDEMLIFTAQKQSGDSSNARYVASSVVKRRELLSCSGKITECYEKFCYGTVAKYGRIFIPYSARIETNQSSKAWLGRGAEVGRSVNMKIFRQPDINNCRYVAWSLSLADSISVPCFPLNLPSIASTNGLSNMNGTPNTMARLPSTTGQLRGAEKSPEFAGDQLGVVVSFTSKEECIIYSAQTGLSQVKAAHWMELGRFVKYDAVKLKNVTSDSKIHWAAKNVTDMGFIFEVVQDNIDETKLHLNIKAVVNRVSLSSRAAWLWNDFIGRIYVPPACFNRNLKSLACVEIRALYTGAFEDVPWSAINIKIVEGEKAELIRAQNAQLLYTSDDWTVKFIQTQTSTFFGFMDNPPYGSAFIAWTDLNDGDTPPPQMSKCRATVYFQQRDGKHAWRAVLVTQLDENSEPIVPHAVYMTTGKREMPEPFVAPQLNITPNLTMPPPGLPPVPPANQWNLSAIKASPPPPPPVPMSTPIKPIDVSTPPPTLPHPIARQFSSFGVIGSGITSQQQHNQHLGSPAQISPPSSDSTPPVGLVSPIGQLADDVFVPTPFSEKQTDWNYSIWGDFTSGDFAKWRRDPQTDPSALSTSTSNSTQISSTSQMRNAFQKFVPVFDPEPVDLSVFASKSSSKVSVETQTDALAEELVLRDMMSSKEFRSMLIKNFPEQFDRICDLKF